MWSSDPIENRDGMEPPDTEESDVCPCGEYAEIYVEQGDGWTALCVDCLIKEAEDAA